MSSHSPYSGSRALHLKYFTLVFLHYDYQRGKPTIMSEWKINNKPSVWQQRRRCASREIDAQVSRRAGIDLQVISIIHKAERSGR